MADLVRRLMGKLMGTGHKDSATGAKLAQYFAVLDKAEAGLAGRVVNYVLTGEPEAILASMATTTARTAWRQGGSAYGLILNPDDDFLAVWRPQQFGRVGEVLAALTPLGHSRRWGLFGTAATPDWLRHALQLFMQHSKPVCSFEDLRAFAASKGAGLNSVLDILLHTNPRRYGSDNSLDVFPGLEVCLAREPSDVLAAVKGLDATARIEFMRAAGRFGLTAPYLDDLVAAGVSSAKTVREAAAKALTGADPARLSSTLAHCYAQGSPGIRAEAVQLALGALGADARPLLDKWQESETERRPREAIERALARLGQNLPAALPAGIDSGYIALDGSVVPLPPRSPMPDDAAIPDRLFDLLRPAMENYNDHLEKTQQEVGKNRLWHWARGQQPLSEEALRQFQTVTETGTKPKDGKVSLLPILWAGPYLKFDRSGVVAFLRSPEVSLRHLVRIIVASYGSLSLLGVLAPFNLHEAAAELRRRLASGADLRTVVALWRELGGVSPVVEFMTTRRVFAPGDIDATMFWPTIAESFDALDDALGLSPQTGGQAMGPDRAIDLLALLPKVPQRYLPPLMAFATGAAKIMREQARRLLGAAPAIDGEIVRLLGDGRQEVRVGAAEWLAARGAATEIPALRRALKSERGDVGRAAIVTALRRLGEDVADFFDRERLLAEATAGLAKTAENPLSWFPLDRLPRIAWADGAAVDPRIPRWWVTLANKLKQPGGNALLDLWLDRLAPGDASRLGLFVLRNWVEQDTRAVSEDEANAHASARVDGVIAYNRSAAMRDPKFAAYFPTDRELIFNQLKHGVLGTYVGSAVDNKGLLALASHVEGADIALIARGYLKNHGARASQCKALLDALAANPAPAAIQIVLAAANRFKARTVRDHAVALIEAISDRRGWTPEELADRTVPHAGLDARGVVELDCGIDRRYRLKLGEDGGVLLLNASGAPVKALPAPRNDEEKPLIEAARAHLATARKETKLVVPAQVARLREAMCLERRWPLDDWRQYLLAHPIVGGLVRRLVWIGRDAAGDIVGSFRPLDDGSFTDCHDAPVALDGIAQVQVAHGNLLSVVDSASWRQHLADYEVTPPVDQFSRDLTALGAKQRMQTRIEDRKGWMIETFKLRGAANRLGYTRGAAEDGGIFMRYERRYEAAGLIVVIEFSGSQLPEENMASVLFDMHFETVRRGSNLGTAALPLGQVPPVLLAESWQDLHDIAAAGTGFDPDWERKAPW